MGIEVREIAALQEGIIGEVDARRGILRHEGDLLGLREQIVGHAVQNEAPDWDRRQDLFRNNLRRIQNVKFEFVGELLIE